MSEQENVQIVQQLYAAYRRGDISAILNALTDDFEWQIPGPADVPWAGTHRGREQVARMFAVFGDTLETQQFEPREFIAQGDKVVALGYGRDRVKSTGRTVEDEWTEVWTLREGKPARVRDYYDTAAFVAAFRSA